MRYIETGEIVSVHGVKGYVKVYPWADSPDFLEGFKNFYLRDSRGKIIRYSADSVRTRKNMVIIHFEGVDTADVARGLVGSVVLLDRSEIYLREGRYFIADLIGCKVINGETGRFIGTVKDIVNHGSCDIYCINGRGGKEYLFPAVDEFLMGTDLESKTIKVKVIEGMFSED